MLDTSSAGIPSDAVCKSNATFHSTPLTAPMSQAKDKKADSESGREAEAYLVFRDGLKWHDVFRLIPGQVTTVGRAATNRIVLRDEICSRNHFEVFQSGSQWVLRDLGSRNGTLINGQRVDGEWDLQEGELIQVGSSELGFTTDLSKSSLEFGESEIPSSAETIEFVLDDIPEPEPEILHRKRITRYDPASTAELVLGRDRISQELAKLYRLALAMGASKNSQQLAETVLDGLLAATGADIGAILLLPKGTESKPKPRQLRVSSYKSIGEMPYQKVSNHLSGLVLSEWEAVLAHDIADDSRLAGRDSLGEIHAKSVICSPIRINKFIHGLIHLYSTDPTSLLEPDDLEFTLAVADQFAVALKSLHEKESLADGLARVQDENQTLRQQLAIESDLVGDSSSLQRLKQLIGRIAPTDATVLIRGESGVGKELVARAIHFSSERKSGPFVCMNCAALSESLLESELFGHEKGSFTGATERKLGKFEQAHRGTLFLDEVGEMSLGIQAKFLRVLEGHPFERVGGGTAIKVNVRVVAATNRELEQAVEDGTFRKDLFYRLYVVDIPVDPLRERRSDIPVLANYFLERFARKTNRPVTGFAEGAMNALMNYDWPGNVRELQNTVERTVILCTGELVSETDIQLSTIGSVGGPPPERAGPSASREIPLEIVEQEHILAILNRTNWNKSRAAQILGIERSTLDRKLKRYQVSRPTN